MSDEDGFKHTLEARLANVVDGTVISRVFGQTRAVRMIEFGLVGTIGAVANFVTLITALTYVGYAIAGTVAFLCGITVAFNGNRLITFDNPSGAIYAQYARYVGVSLGGYAVYMIALWVAAKLLLLPVVIAGLIATGLGGLLNFVGSIEYAFNITDD